MDYILPQWIVWTFMVLFWGVIAGAAWIYIHFYMKQNTDKVIFIDESNRWELVSKNLSEVDKFDHKKGKYFLKADAGLLNKKGKKLFLYSLNKPSPMKLKYNDVEWLDAESLMGTINNELVKLMVKPGNQMKDNLLLFGAIGGILAGIASLINLAITTGLFSG